MFLRDGITWGHMGEILIIDFVKFHAFAFFAVVRRMHPKVSVFFSLGMRFIHMVFNGQLNAS